MMKRVNCFAFAFSVFFGKQAEYFILSNSKVQEKSVIWLAITLHSSDHTATCHTAALLANSNSKESSFCKIASRVCN